MNSVGQDLSNSTKTIYEDSNKIIGYINHHFHEHWRVRSLRPLHKNPKMNSVILSP